MATSLESWDTMAQIQHTRRRAITAGAAILAALLVGVVLVVKLWPDSGSPSRGAAKGPDLTWETVATGTQLPVIRSAGPFVQNNGLASGFAHSELGAVMAAIHISDRAAGAHGPSVFEITIRNQVVGDDSGAMLTRAQAGYEQKREELGLPEGRPIPSNSGGNRLLAYKIERYGPDSAVVTLISGVGVDAQKFFAGTAEVRWINGDWRLVAPKQGAIENAFSELGSIPTGSVTFEGKR